MTLRCSSTCQTAKTPGCDCPCNGVNHGMKGRLAWARAAVVESGAESPGVEGPLQECAARRKNAVKRIASRAEAQQKKRKPRLLKGDVRALVESARTVDTVTWLIEHPDTLAQFEALAEELGGIGVDALGRLSPTGVRRPVPEHFWCDVIATVVDLLEALQASEAAAKRSVVQLVDRLVDEAYAAVAADLELTTVDPAMTDKDAAAPGVDTDVVVAFALRIASREFVTVALTSLTAGPDAVLSELLLKLRVVGLLLCPDPSFDKHQAVWEHCVLPLLGSAVTAQLTERFAAIFGLTSAGGTGVPQTSTPSAAPVP